jgi:LysR family transcriptional regulator, chromosome initiation inhibitor
LQADQRFPRQKTLPRSGEAGGGKDGECVDFDYESLKVLEAVVRTGSFEQAAKLLNVTQSAVSQRIKQLEERVGSLLIVRGRPCVPTEDGLLLCQHIDQVTLLQHELRDRMGGPKGNTRAAVSIRIAVNNDSLATWFAKVLKRAGEELNLRLEVIPDDQEFTEERLRSGEALAVVTTNEKAIPGCHLVSLGEMEYVGIASPAFVAAHMPGTITLEQVARAPAIRYDQKDTLPEQWMRASFGEALPIAAHIIPSYEGNLRCALDSVGWAIMPTMTVGPMIRDGTLIDLAPGRAVPMQLQWQYRTQSSTILLKLSDIVRDVAASEFATGSREG